MSFTGVRTDRRTDRRTVRGRLPVLWVALILGISLMMPRRASAQPVMQMGLRHAASGEARRIDTRERHSRVALDPRSGQAPWWAPLASGVIPGTGQFALGQQRSVGYAVAELYLVVQALAARRDGNRDRDEYRSLAADVARRPFSLARPTGAWDYYESMEKFVASGVYDRTPGGAVDPETDEATYNGTRWRLARETFWQDPNTTPPQTSAAYQRALTFYTDRAVTDEYRWSWRDAQLQQDVYRQTISSANRRYQRAVNFAGVVATNHLVSLIDAYVTVRVRRFGGVRVGGLRVDGIESRVEMPRGAVDLPRLSMALRLVPSAP